MEVWNVREGTERSGGKLHLLFFSHATLKQALCCGAINTFCCNKLLSYLIMWFIRPSYRDLSITMASASKCCVLHNAVTLQNVTFTFTVTFKTFWNPNYRWKKIIDKYNPVFCPLKVQRPDSVPWPQICHHMLAYYSFEAAETVWMNARNHIN